MRCTVWSYSSLENISVTYILSKCHDNPMIAASSSYVDEKAKVKGRT
jgi:hypothetical protein